ARAVHDVSVRRGTFIPVNCGALPRSLIESELFGHRRGAFSGANEERDGLVRRAHNGTLFLDEIAELPEESQVALLRVLQEGEVRPVGANDTVKVDVRVVAATRSPRGPRQLDLDDPAAHREPSAPDHAASLRGAAAAALRLAAQHPRAR